MINKLIGICGTENVLPNETLSRHTTFKTGGAAKALVYACDEEKLKEVIKLCKAEKVPFFILGNGSNLLVSDEGFDGIVIKLSGNFLKTTVEGDRLTAGAGVILSKVCTLARDNSLSGLEFAFGIPGTVGGAMVMNAGAYGGEMAMAVENVRMLEPDGNIRDYLSPELSFGYRDSILKHKDLVALETTFKLERGDKSEISAKMDELLGRRREKQPLEFPSAGSTFKRPEGYFAGKLIEDAGLKGLRVGGASVSVKHSGFIINDRNATSKDINDLINLVRSGVSEKFNVTLEPEVIKIGEFEGEL